MVFLYFTVLPSDHLSWMILVYLILDFCVTETIGGIRRTINILIS
jgi:hypothetical protein